MIRSLPFTEEHDIFRTHVRRFLDRECVPHVDTWLKDGIVPKSAWLKAGEAGLLCMGQPEEYGGAGGDFLHTTIFSEEMADALVEGPGWGLHNDIVAPYIETFGSEDQKQKWLPRMATGELISAIAMTEPGTGSDLQGVKTTAVRDGNHYLINGQKTFITNGQNANLIIVVTKTNPEKGAKGTSLIVVETDEVEGFQRGRNLEKVGQHAQDTSELFFDDVRVPTGNLLGEEEGLGFIQLMEMLPQERLLVGVGAVAAAETALRLTSEYVKERKAFGRPIADFQNTRFKLAEVKTQITAGRIFVDRCIELLLEGNLDVTTAAMVKLWTSEMEFKVMDECLQLFGGYGYMNEYPISRMWTAARVQRIYAGTSEIMKELIGRSI
ncbi:MAG: acyl-CoA dehydrogenase family protein [Rhodospirillales bacterium]|nr:acyl-CoA dehydrogenase family protein [Rhodospirillales bacterium]